MILDVQEARGIYIVVDDFVKFRVVVFFPGLDRLTVQVARQSRVNRLVGYTRVRQDRQNPGSQRG